MIYSKCFFGALVVFYGTFSLSLSQSVVAAPAAVATAPIKTQVNNDLPPRFCPQPGELVKNNIDLKWTTKDNKWTSYTPSAAIKILGFLGAQWVGIKVGEVICLYQTDEAAAFTLELQQVKVQSILEPKGAGWSSAIGNRRICKSVNVADCRYLIEPPKDTSNVYDEIKYAPNKGN